MSTETYTVQNGSISEVKVTASYSDPQKIPVIGQKKRMRVNGKPQTMYLVRVTARRDGEYDEDDRLHLRFDTEEEWAGYYDF